MSLQKCSECGGVVSSKATTCPHCGCPVTSGLNNSLCTYICDGQSFDLSEVFEHLDNGREPSAYMYIMRNIYCNLQNEDISGSKVVRDIYAQYSQLRGCPPIDPRPNRPKCPTCGSTNIERLGASTRAAAGVMFGLFSSTARSQFRCLKCGYKW